MREAKSMGLVARLGVAGYIPVQLVSFRAPIKDKISAYLLYTYYDAL